MPTPPPSPAPLAPRDTGARGPAALAAWLATHRATLQEWLDADGAVLLRGHGPLAPEDVATCLAALGLRGRAYGEGLARRVELAPGVYSATTVDPASPLALHAELAHTAAPPALLVFACLRPADAGGESLLADGLAVPAALGPTWAAWKDRRLAYLTCRPATGGPLALGRPWPEVFHTPDRAAVDAALTADGATWTWDDTGALRTRLEGPVARVHPATGRPLWYNHLLLWHATALGARGRKLRALLPPGGLPHDATWADGTPLPDDEVDAARATVDALAVPIAWEPGDLVLVDNHRMMHGRRAYRGDRRLTVSLCDPA